MSDGVPFADSNSRKGVLSMLQNQHHCRRGRLQSSVLLLPAVFAALSVCPLPAQTATPGSKAHPAASPSSSANPAKTEQLTATNRSLPSIPKREHAYYDVLWGVDSLRTKAIESGELIQFSYRVLDPEKAKTLNDKANEAFLFAPELHAKLVVPSLEKVGQLRQTSSPEQGKIYWMAFSNPGGLVKKGDRVNVVIGNFHVAGLTVQ
jgi:hypothetical protein